MSQSYYYTVSENTYWPRGVDKSLAYDHALFACQMNIRSCCVLDNQFSDSPFCPQIVDLFKIKAQLYMFSSAYNIE